MHIRALESCVALDDIRRAMHRTMSFLSQKERSYTARQIAFAAIACLSWVREHHLSMIASTEVVVSIITCVDPDRLFCIEQRSEKPAIDSLTSNSLFLVSWYRVKVGKIHEFWDGFVEEDEVT